jgi:hypothetical protein
MKEEARLRKGPIFNAICQALRKNKTKNDSKTLNRKGSSTPNSSSARSKSKVGVDYSTLGLEAAKIWAASLEWCP